MQGVLPHDAPCFIPTTRFSFYPHSMVLPDQLDDLIIELKKNKAKVSGWAGS
jgi:hypothetical protein